MKFKFAPKGDYLPQQIITINGVEWMVESVSHTRRSLFASTPFRGYKDMPKFERIQAILTDESSIAEVVAMPTCKYCARDLDDDQNQGVCDSDDCLRFDEPSIEGITR